MTTVARIRGDIIGNIKLRLRAHSSSHDGCGQLKAYSERKAIGQLVQLGFDVTAFTPAAYRRPRLGRPSMEI